MIKGKSVDEALRLKNSEVVDELGGLPDVKIHCSVLAEEAIKKANRKQLLEGLGIGEFTFNDILDAFIAPLRDPRDEFDKPILKQGVIDLSQLKPGMELQGTIRNVVDFGVFVDCGVHEDGLVHISKISKRHIKHPLDVVSVGQIVTVWVVSVDLRKNRLELTMIDPSKR